MRIAALLAAVVSLYAAEPKFEFWPGAQYDPKVPTFRQVLGYDAGERISPYTDILRYLDALAKASPRLKVFEYGKSWEGRKLVYAAVASEANIARLKEFQSSMQRLADPRKTPPAEAQKLIASLPAIVWLAYGVHGNEVSSPDAALLTAYHLIASRDKATADILANTLVILIPSQNPDGRDRFVNHFEQNAGLEPDASPVAAEHIEPWPGGRGNHYLFDLNRDWVPLTQPEIRSQVKALLQWFPLVYVDLHEMGSNSTYYFAPEAVPYNPHLTKDQKDSLEWFGRNNAKWFDKFGFDYFTREVFDAFYPGYGASWPCYYGGVAMTYEQASSRGLKMRRLDDSEFHFRDTVRQHFTASISTIETTSHYRSELLKRFYDYRKSAIDEGGREAVKEYILPRKGDTATVDKLAALLSEHGIEVKRAATAFRNGTSEFPAGSYIVPMAQPAKRLVRVLLDPDVPMEAGFLKEQERLRKKKLPDEIYDVTAWSLPLSFNVECVGVAEPSPGSFESVRPERIPAGRINAKQNAIAYIAAWGTQAAGRLLTGALRKNLNVLSTDKPFVNNGKRYPAGSLVFKVTGNQAGLAATLEQLTEETGADLDATDSGWMDEGVNFGSRRVVRLRKPAIALAWDRPTSSSAAGWTRFVIERQFGYPVTAVRSQMLATADLSKFHVIVLPDTYGDYGLGAAGARRLKDWVASGGTLVAIGGAVSWLAQPSVGLLAVSQENAARPKAEPAKPPEGAKPIEGDKAAEASKTAEAAKPDAASGRVAGKLFATEEEYLKAVQAATELPDSVVGAIARAKLDPDNWVTAGIADTVTALVSGRSIFTPIKLDKGVNAAVFAGPNDLLASGYMWEENRKQFAYKPLVIVQKEGRGNIIAFTADPNYRAMMDGMNLLLLNAVFRGPGRAQSEAEAEE
ncbi:MAG TPA: M14 family zinc carboxypeptidase [Bryobacteraceae bacterium]|nr:M14 family zinc carboxypeptidase [Bryobacteraceae bacterium]